MTCEELLILRENYKFKVKLADTSKILRKLVDKQLLILGAIGKGMKFYINKNFDNTDGIVPSETEKLVLNYIQKNGLIKREDVETLLNVKESRAREILRNMSQAGKIIKISSGRNTYYEENKWYHQY